jgi:hypothetical protein
MTVEESAEFIRQLPRFCFDYEVVNLVVTQQYFLFLAACAEYALDFLLFDETGCLDSGLL